MLPIREKQKSMKAMLEVLKDQMKFVDQQTALLNKRTKDQDFNVKKCWDKLTKNANVQAEIEASKGQQFFDGNDDDCVAERITENLVLIARADAVLGNEGGDDSDESLTDSVINKMYQEANKQKKLKSKNLWPVVDDKPTRLKKPEVKKGDLQKQEVKVEVKDLNVAQKQKVKEAVRDWKVKHASPAKSEYGKIAVTFGENKSPHRLEAERKRGEAEKRKRARAGELDKLDLLINQQVSLALKDMDRVMEFTFKE